MQKTTMIDPIQFNRTLEEFLRFAEQIRKISSKFPQKWPANYRNQKNNELIPLLSVLRYVNHNYEIVNLQSEEPDFIIDLAGDRIGVEILDYVPDEKEAKDLRHWNDLCEKLEKEYLPVILKLPAIYEIEIKDLSVKGCSYDAFKKDFQSYLLGKPTRYIAKVRPHKDKRIVACVNQGPNWLKTLDIEGLLDYIHTKKDNKVTIYQQNTGSADIWLIVNIRLSSSADIEYVPTDYIKTSPFSKIYLVKGNQVKQIWSK